MLLDTEKFKDLFLSEADEQIATLSRILLEIEKTPGQPEQYETLMRSAHTIKGSAATMGYTEITQLAHALEDVFHMAERGALTIDSSLVSTLLLSVDALSEALRAVKAGRTDWSAKDYVVTLEQLLTAPDAVVVAQSHQQRAPSTESLIIAVPTVVKVHTDRLDSLMGIFEELLMLKLKFDMMLEPVIDLARTTTDMSQKQNLYFVHEFRSLLNDMAGLLSENQDALLSIRLVPLDQIFGQYPRMVRDLAVRQGKKITFTIEGGEIALDRTVIDGLGGALAHLLRNAVDHGIVGEGKILLRASRELGRAKVIVEDDGAGMDYARIRDVAISRGVDTKEHILEMGNAALAEIIFQPNMSTNNEVTDVSGRGVGVSAVHAFARDVGGHLEVISPIPELGKGTRFSLDLPVSLATVRVLVVLAGGYTFAVPFESIVRTHEFAEHDIGGVAHQETLFVDGALLPLLRLRNILGLEFSSNTAPVVQEAPHVGILIHARNAKVVLDVDECTGEQELLVKSLPPVLQRIKGFSGSALLPDGRTILLLDIQGLLAHAVGDILDATKA